MTTYINSHVIKHRHNNIMKPKIELKTIKDSGRTNLIKWDRPRARKHNYNLM